MPRPVEVASPPTAVAFEPNCAPSPLPRNVSSSSRDGVVTFAGFAPVGGVAAVIAGSSWVVEPISWAR